MLANYFCPYFKFTSFSFVAIVVTFMCMIVPQVLFPASGNGVFLKYRMMRHVYVTPVDIKHLDHWYGYEAVTGLFFHTGWVHWVNNVLGILLVVMTMEYSWNLTWIFLIIGGAVANCYFVLVSDLVTMGFGVGIACSIGLSVGMLIANRGYMRRNRSEMLTIWMISSIFVFILIATSTHIIIHFFGLLIGILYGCAWIPQL